MRSLERNKKTIYYCSFISKTPLLDGNNLETGEYKLLYDCPKRMRVCISPAKGSDNFNMFGISLDYDKTITIDKNTSPIEETTMIFIDKLPQYNYKYKTLLNKDYIVSVIATSLNNIVIALKKVKDDYDKDNWD